jgi:DNA repair protein radC
VCGRKHFAAPQTAELAEGEFPAFSRRSSADQEGNITMHEGHRERLRQTFLEHGASTLHEHQLLELLLTYAIPRRDTNPLAHSLLAAYGSLDKVLAANPYDLMRQEGIGRQAAVLLALAGALMQRGGAARPEKAALNTPEAASRYCMALLAGAKYEETYVISLDKRRAVLHADKVASGTLGETVLYPRLVLECALRHGANSVILTHNHPSGNPQPSSEDVKTTRSVYDALQTVSITLHDHIIVGDGCTYSMVRGAVLRSGEVPEERRRIAEEEK